MTSLTIVLDSTPLGTLAKRIGIHEADECNSWVRDCRLAGHRVKVPAIAYYEVARELRRSGQAGALRRLEFLCQVPDAYLPITDNAIRLAVQLWANSRNAGRPTSDPRELDCDVLIAAQALDFEPDQSHLIVATSNIGHLEQFVAAKHWRDIQP